MKKVHPNALLALIGVGKVSKDALVAIGSLFHFIGKP
jgi:hypothetical protein